MSVVGGESLGLQVEGVVICRVADCLAYHDRHDVRLHCRTCLNDLHQRTRREATRGRPWIGRCGSRGDQIASSDRALPPTHGVDIQKAHGHGRDSRTRGDRFYHHSVASLDLVVRDPKNGRANETG